MGVARRWVFPILRLVIFAAIAVALIKIAFIDSTSDDSSPVQPTAEIVEPQIPVTVGTIRNDVVLDGTVNADAAVAIKATLAGEVRKVIAAQGQRVDAGAELFTIRSETPGELLPDGTIGRSVIKTETVKAPVAGVISSLPVIVGQLVTVGEAAGQIAPPSFNVSATLQPAQQYRLLNQPTDAQVAITGGPAPFTCGSLTITTPLAGETQGGEGEGAGGAGASGTTVRCAVPADVTVFPGLAAKVTIAGGLAENVLTLPATAVEGAAQSGTVYAMLPEGGTEPRPVTLGLSDGTTVEITGGVAEGDLVLQFVPGAEAGPEGGVPAGCVAQPDGSMFCGSGG